MLPWNVRTGCLFKKGKRVRKGINLKPKLNYDSPHAGKNVRSRCIFLSSFFFVVHCAVHWQVMGKKSGSVRR